MRTSTIAKIPYAGVAIFFLVLGASISILLLAIGAVAVDRGGPDSSRTPPSWATYSALPVLSTAITNSSAITSTLESIPSPTTIFRAIPSGWPNITSVNSSTIISVADPVTNPSRVPGTTLVTSPSPSASSSSYTFSIEISNQRQHVGNWYGHFISDDVTRLLKNRCDDRKTGANTCKTSREKFDNIEYSNKGGYVEKGNQFVQINVESDYIPGENEGGVHYNGKSLQTALIAQIADTFQKSGEDEKNCYRFNRKSTLYMFCKVRIRPPFPDERGDIIRWCNAPEYVRASVKNGEGKEVAHMKVVLRFTGPTDKGRFDCMAIREGVEKSARDNRVREVKDAVGGKEVEARATCSGEEVTGNCPGECLYKLGGCFKKSG